MSEMVAENIQIRERFVCDNDMKAEWCLNKIRKARAEFNREAEELDRQMQFYMDQKEMLKHKTDEEVEFFEEILHGYFNSRVDDGFTKETKTKVSYKLPTGNLILKHREPEYDYKTNQKEAIEWLKQNGGEKYIKIKEELNWKDLKDASIGISDGKVLFKEKVTKDGEIIQLFVPGITVTDREDEFEVEVK